MFLRIKVLIFLSRLDSLALKFVFVIKFACVNLALKSLTAKVLKSGVVIYLPWVWSLILFPSSLIFVPWSVFLTKLLALDILFLTAVNADFVVKPLTSVILLSNSVNSVFNKISYVGNFLFYFCFACLIFGF